jgi:GNAT superfamily N-acetyltransferase
VAEPILHDLSIADFEENSRVNRKTLELIDKGLTDYNWSISPDPSASPLVLVLNENETTVAGAVGRSAYGWMRVDVIWVSKDIRGKGYGRLLLQRVEEIAVKRGCKGIHLDTHEFQAPDFYVRLGYEVFGELPNYPEGETHYYLKKEFQSGGA